MTTITIVTVICAEGGVLRESGLWMAGLEPEEDLGSGWGHRCGPLFGSLRGASQEGWVPFHPPAPMTSWPPTLLTEFTVLCLHLFLIIITTVIVIVGVVLHVLEAEAGHIGHVRAHFLGAPVGRDAGGSAGPEQGRVEVGAVVSPDILLL